MDWLIWLGIGFCLTQSAMFSGLNLAYFSVSRIRLEVEVSNGNSEAKKVRNLRQDSNFLLTTLLWGNVGINVLLTLLSDSVLSGITAFAFSTIFITLFGEILPQAYFSRYALVFGARFSPILRFYQFLLYPVAKPSAMILDKLLGKEGISFWREHDLKQFITQHMHADGTEVGKVEGIGAVNFLNLDDGFANSEGEFVDPASIIAVPFQGGHPQFPKMTATADDPFIKQLNGSIHKWSVITDLQGWPQLLLHTDKAVRYLLSHPEKQADLMRFCFKPAIIQDGNTRLEDVVKLLKINEAPDVKQDSAIPLDAVLVWTQQPRIITGADVLGRLLRGIHPHH